MRRPGLTPARRVFSTLARTEGRRRGREETRSEEGPAGELESQGTGAEDVVFTAAFEAQLRNCVDELDPKEELVLKMRFGFDNGDPKTLKQIGDHLSLSRERIRQIEAAALQKLRRMQRCQTLKSYLN